jgi:asparagine synthase (glutamine-hydrolysing)
MADKAALGKELRDALSASVSRYAPERPGTFLSGGLDSSTVTGLLAAVREGDVDAYSIGFAAEGYDEMAYARLAARHFGVRHHEHYVTPDEVMAAIPAIAAAYDEPFGNSSAVPTYLCARLAAANGSRMLLAGDGGDELFAGNARYLKQGIFGCYSRLPAAFRTLLAAAQERQWAVAVPQVRKLHSYVAQARIPLPDRLQTYNFMERQPLAEILAPALLERIDPEASRRLLREEYHLDRDASELNRMLRLDWRFTLADNDLRKVGTMTQLAGVEVRYPMLDDAVAAVSLRIPTRLKMKRHTLRAFYKEAFRGFLPEAILAKTKHGFGLPFGVWVLSHPGLHQMAYDAIIALKKRDLIAPTYLDRLADRHREEHAAYYGELIWVLMMLELWFQNEEGRRTEERQGAASGFPS